MTKKIGKHRDSRLAYGLSRYFLIDLILESNSFLELEKKIQKDEIIKRESSYLIFREFKLSNLVLKIEYSLTSLLERFYKKKILNKENSYNFVFKKIKKFRYLDDNETKAIIKKETLGKEKNIYSPHMLFYVAGLGFGDLVNIIKDFTNSFENKKDIIDKLTKFRDYRNNLVHNLLSTRIESEREIKKALILGKELYESLEKMIKKYSK